MIFLDNSSLQSMKDWRLIMGNSNQGGKTQYNPDKSTQSPHSLQNDIQAITITLCACFFDALISDVHSMLTKNSGGAWFTFGFELMQYKVYS